MATKKVVFEIDIKGSKQVFELQKQIAELKKQLRATKDPTVAEQLLKELAQLEAGLKKAKAEARAAQKEFEAKDSTIGSYKQLSAQLFLARERFKNLAASAAQGGKVTAEELNKARAEAARLDATLKRVDAATGVFGRNVGNYAGSLKGLFANLKQTIQTSGFIGRGGILQFGQQLYGQITQILDAFDKLNTTFSVNAQLGKKIQDGTKEVIGQFVTERRELDVLTTALKDSNTPVNEKREILETLNEKYPDYFKNIDAENVKQGEVEEAYKKANKQILAGLKQRLVLQTVEKQAQEALEKQLEADAANALKKAANDIAVFDLTTTALINLNASYANGAAKTAKTAQQSFSKIEELAEGVVSVLEQSLGDYELAIGDVGEFTGKAAKDLAQKEKEAQEKRRKEYEKTLEAAKKAREQFAKDEAQFQKQQAAAFTDLQNQIKQAVIDNIEDEGVKVVAQEKLNYELRKAERAQQQADLEAALAAQEQRIIEVFGQGSAELLRFQEETYSKLFDIEAQFAALSEQDATAHQMRLKAIEGQGQQERSQQEQDAFAARLEATQAQLTDIENAYQLSVLQLEQSLAEGLIKQQEFEQKRYALQLQAIEDEKQLLQQRLDNGIFASEAERQAIVLQLQRLNTERAKAESDYTEKVKQESEKQKEARIESIQSWSGVAQQAISGIEGLVSAAYDAELNEIGRNLEARQNSISQLEEQLTDAGAFQKEYLKQRIAEEKFAAEQIAKEQDRVRKESAKANKAFALFQAGINAALSITNLLATLIDPTPVQAFKIAALAFTTALNVAQIAAIAATPLSGFASGGYTGSGTGSPDATGFKPAGVVHEGEWVAPKWLVNSAEFGGVIQRLEGVRSRGYAAGGMVASVPNVPTTLQSSSAQITQLSQLTMQVMNLAIATNNRIDKLQVQYGDNAENARKADEKNRKQIQYTAQL